MESADVIGKRLELLREVVPRLRRLAVMANASYSATVLEMNEVQHAARINGLEAVTLGIRRTEDIEPGFESLKGEAVILSAHSGRCMTGFGWRVTAIVSSVLLGSCSTAPSSTPPCTVPSGWYSRARR
jgi:putative ABC transport system substrate-binding protein